MKTAFSEDYSVITFATNKLSYLQFALNCARSILLFNDINIYIVSNLNIVVPGDIKNNVFIIPAKPEHAVMGIGIKLYMDEYLQTDNTLFIDSDCICFDSLTPIFKAAEGMHVTVAGNIVPTEDWCGPVYAKEIKENFGLAKIIRFNGGLYYFKKTGTTKKIFEMARKIEATYHYGFDSVNNKWINEEAQLSISMVLNKQNPMPDNGCFITDLFTDRRPRGINVLTGSRFLQNPPPPSDKHCPWYPSQYSPLIVHFGGNQINAYPYISQHWLLKLYRLHIPVFIGTLLVNIFIHTPYRTFYWITGLLRKLRTR